MCDYDDVLLARLFKGRAIGIYVWISDPKNSPCLLVIHSPTSISAVELGWVGFSALVDRFVFSRSAQALLGYRLMKSKFVE